MRQNRYCGPFALAHVAGITPNEAAALFREISGARYIKSVSTWLMGQGLRRVASVEWIGQFNNPTMAKWNRQRRLIERQNANRARTWVVCTTSHYIVVRGATIWDNKNPEGVHLRDYFRRARVRKAWLVR